MSTIKDIPYKELKLSQVFDLQMGKTPSRNNPQYWEGRNKWLSISDLDGDKIVTKTREAITDLALQDTNIKKVPQGTVVMSFKLSIGKTAITGEDMYTNEAIMAFHIKDGYEVDTDFLYHWCKSNNWLATTNKAVMGLTLNKATMMDKEIKLPDISRQKEIAIKLNKVDDALLIGRKQLEMLDLLIKSRFIEMFGDKDYPHKKLVEVACIGSSKRIYANEYVSEGVPFYRSKEIRELGDGKKPSVELFISSEKYNFLKDRFGVPQKGDILIAAIGATIGYMWVINTDNPFYYKDGNLILISDFRELNSVYLEFILKKIISKFKEQGAAGSAQLALTIEKVEKMEVAVPPIDLQNQFADFVAQVDKSKLAVQQSLDELETLKKSLMQQYFG